MKKYLVSNKGNRQWQGIPTIEQSSDGRLWCAFFSGGPREPDSENKIYLTCSNDDGISWSDVVCVVDPQGKTRAYDPCLWIDPDNQLWLFYNMANTETQCFDSWYIQADPTARVLCWSKPTRIDISVPFCFRLNKPTVLFNGDWVLPITWSDELPGKWLDESGRHFPGTDWFVKDGYQGAAISKNQGKSWTLHGRIEAPHWALENMVVQRQDGTLWMLIRTNSGVLWQSLSHDDGITWSPGEPTEIVNPGSRFFIRRLRSGFLILINSDNPTERRGLVASLSRDEHSFHFFSEIETQLGVSYPDAVESNDGRVFIVYDYDRYGEGAIYISILDVHNALF